MSRFLFAISCCSFSQLENLINDTSLIPILALVMCQLKLFCFSAVLAENIAYINLALWQLNLLLSCSHRQSFFFFSFSSPRIALLSSTFSCMYSLVIPSWTTHGRVHWRWRLVCEQFTQSHYVEWNIQESDQQNPQVDRKPGKPGVLGDFYNSGNSVEIFEQKSSLSSIKYLRNTTMSLASNEQSLLNVGDGHSALVTCYIAGVDVEWSLT